MFEYEINNNKTGEVDFIWGHNIEDAWRKSHNLNRDDWTIVFSEYID